jgi:opacity protein-like surface antigen
MIFGNPLIGGAFRRVAVSSVSPTVTDTEWAYALGGGASYKLSSYFALRGQADYIRTHFPETLDRNYQNNYRVSVGIVFQFN